MTKKNGECVAIANKTTDFRGKIKVRTAPMMMLDATPAHTNTLRTHVRAHNS